MVATLAEQIREIAQESKEKDIAEKFLTRLKEGSLTRDENPQTHFCVFFQPYNPATKQVFIADHKKSGLWLSPGGHIDKEEDLLQAVNREISEELGVRSYFPHAPKPFLLTVTYIENGARACKVHYDTWYLMETNGDNFQVDLSEFHQVKWLPIPEAKKLATHSAMQKNFETLEELYP